jgi:hypothetical protein
MKARRFALALALVLALSAATQPAYAGWSDPQDGPVTSNMSASFELCLQLSGTSLAVVQAAL